MFELVCVICSCNSMDFTNSVSIVLLWNIPILEISVPCNRSHDDRCLEMQTRWRMALSIHRPVCTFDSDINGSDVITSHYDECKYCSIVGGFEYCNKYNKHPQVICWDEIRSDADIASNR